MTSLREVPSIGAEQFSLGDDNSHLCARGRFLLSLFLDLLLRSAALFLMASRTFSLLEEEGLESVAAMVAVDGVSVALEPSSGDAVDGGGEDGDEAEDEVDATWLRSILTSFLDWRSSSSSCFSLLWFLFSLSL